jgi:hypothetical protein
VQFSLESSCSSPFIQVTKYKFSASLLYKNYGSDSRHVQLRFEAIVRQRKEEDPLQPARDNWNSSTAFPRPEFQYCLPKKKDCKSLILSRCTKITVGQPNSSATQIFLAQDDIRRTMVRAILLAFHLMLFASDIFSHPISRRF